ncbi:MAG: polyamine ABC transporter ATP-binding protein, partial [Proteobacteria bacterium]|nr:polyamine ABC transporter ATP-binding protein [Pseudomonadota bacterium]
MATSSAPDHSSADKSFLKIEGLSKSYGGVCALDRVGLTVAKGEIFALLGASGSGKTTLLNILAGLFQPDEGRLELDGVDLLTVPPHRRPVNMMFQSYALFPHMTVEKNIAFGLEQEGLPRADVAKRVEEMLALVHMESYARRKPQQLSGGQQQRVAMARSLAKRPKLLLLDEPMGALDRKLRAEMQFEVVSIIERTEVTCVMVTHDQEEAMTMAWRLAVMDTGRICQVGSPREVYEHPNSRLTAEFIGTVNILSGVIRVDEADHAILDCHDISAGLRTAHGVTGSVGMPKEMALRPEYLHL